VIDRASTPHYRYPFARRGPRSHMTDRFVVGSLE